MDDLEAILVDTPPHEGVVAEMSTRHGLDRSASEALFDDLVLFLVAAARLETEAIPSASIDDAWHAFILYTGDYADWCSRRFGRFLHHRPARQAEGIDLAILIAERDSASRASRDAMASVVGNLRAPGWPHHRARFILPVLAEPVVQDVVLTLLDDTIARRRYLESPLGWLGSRREELGDDCHLTIYDFFGGALRHIPEWPGVTDKVREAALAQVFDGAIAS